METKLLEIRDSATFMPHLAIKLTGDTMQDHFLLKRAGFGITETYILFHPLCSSDINYDPYNWQRGARTVPIAHKYVIEHWDEIKSGDVIDVQFILGETSEKKISERLEVYP